MCFGVPDQDCWAVEERRNEAVGAGQSVFHNEKEKAATTQHHCSQGRLIKPSGMEESR